MGYIYMIQNKINKKVYVGQTIYYSFLALFLST